MGLQGSTNEKHGQMDLKYILPVYHCRDTNSSTFASKLSGLLILYTQGTVTGFSFVKINPTFPFVCTTLDDFAASGTICADKFIKQSFSNINQSGNSGLLEHAKCFSRTIPINIEFPISSCLDNSSNWHHPKPVVKETATCSQDRTLVVKSIRRIDSLSNTLYG